MISSELLDECQESLRKKSFQNVELHPLSKNYDFGKIIRGRGSSLTPLHWFSSISISFLRDTGQILFTKFDNIFKREAILKFFNLHIRHTLYISRNFNPVQDEWPKESPTSFSSVTSRIVGPSPQNFVTFSFDPFEHWCKTLRVSQSQSYILKLAPKASLEKVVFFLSNLFM